MTLQKKGHNSG